MNLQEKLDKLNIDSYDDTDRKTIESWKERVIKLTADKDFLNHPITQEIAKECQNEILRIENILKNDEFITEENRKALFRERSAHKFYLSLFTKDVDGELKVIESLVDEQI